MRFINIQFEHNSLFQSLQRQQQKFELIAVKLLDTLDNGNTIYICGNGGSASQAEHFAAELRGRFSKKKRKALKVYSLTENTAALTAIANDFGYADVFSRQLEAASKGDVLIGLTTSGMSKNVIKALNQAKRQGMLTVGIVGNVGKIKADLLLTFPKCSTPRVQEIHLVILHELANILDR
jgi:D-sedoheptulose 7-phosphate isomerase